MHVPHLGPLRGLAATLGLALLLGCGGLFSEEPVDDDGVAAAETGDTGEPEEEPDEEEDEDDAADSAPTDTGPPQRKPREGKRKKKDRKKRGGGGGGGGGKAKPSPKPSVKRLCFGGDGLDLRFQVSGSDVKGSLAMRDKVDVPKLTGTRSGKRIQASGKGMVNGQKKTVKVQAGKGESGAVVKIDGRHVKGAKVVDCR